MTPKEIARKSAQALWQHDHASQWFGMNLDDVDEGTAVVSLVIEQHHVNGLGTCHGGVTFALADSAFAFACNSRNQATVAQNNTITYIAPARIGDKLTATAKELSLSGRSAIYDVEVRNQLGAVIAQFRGGSRSVRGTVIKDT